MHSPLALLEIPVIGLLVVALVLFLTLLWLGYARAPRIFGFGSHVVKTVETVEYTSDDEVTGKPQKRSITTETQSARTVWEWLTVLAISAALGVVALMFTARQAQQQREVQHDQANDEAIQVYFDQMSTLLIEDKLRTSPEDSEARTLARSRTLTILSRLDPQRRSQVFEFLLEAELIQRTVLTTHVIDLNAWFNTLQPTFPTKDAVINLSGANLSGFSVPADTNLSFVDLSGADLSEADLSEANLSTAYLTATNLHNANLSRATLSYSDLGSADLNGANLSDVDLTLATLEDADMTNADLSGADLWAADLSDAEGVTQDSLVEQAGYVGQTTMPDEDKYIGPDPWRMSLKGYPRDKIPPVAPGKPIRAREYNSDEFVPAFHFEVGKGWEGTSSGEQTTYMPLCVDFRFDQQKYASETSELIITNPLSIVDTHDLSDARNSSELETVPAPENANKWASWFQEHPNLETSEPKPVSVGGAPGIQIDVTDVSPPENSAYVPIFFTNLSELVAFPARKERFLILNVGEETVVINISIPADKSQESFSKAQDLLDTIQWTGV